MVGIYTLEWAENYVEWYETSLNGKQHWETQLYNLAKAITKDELAGMN